MIMDDSINLEDMLRRNRENNKAKERFYKSQAYSMLDAKVLEVGSNSIKYSGSKRKSNSKQNAHFTAKKGFIDDLRNKQNNLSKSARLAIAAFALAAGSLFAVKFIIPQSPEIDTTNLKNISVTDFDDLALDSDDIQQIVSFAEDYDLNFSSKRITRDSLAKSYDNYYELCGNVLRSKISNITGVPKDEICVLKDNDEYSIVQGYVNDSGLVVSQGTLISSDKVPDVLLPVLKDYVDSINVHKEVDPFGLYSNVQLNKRSKRLKNSIIQLLDIADDELVFDGENYELVQVEPSRGIGRSDLQSENDINER